MSTQISEIAGRSLWIARKNYFCAKNLRYIERDLCGKLKACLEQNERLSYEARSMEEVWDGFKDDILNTSYIMQLSIYIHT